MKKKEIEKIFPNITDEQLKELEKLETEAYEKGKNLFSETQELFSLDDRFFTAVSNSDTGEVSDETIFAYHQKDNVIWAEYSGGSIIKGFLLGTIDDNNNLHFDYRHINASGESKSGSCVSKPRVENGKLRFYENWKWSDGIEGTSIIEEL